MKEERLTANFWLSEFLRSEAATRKGLSNTPNEEALACIRVILAPGMQQVRNILRAPVLITSGYRSQAVNRAVGGAKESWHCLGLAADFVAPEFGMPRTVVERLMLEGDLHFDQLIHEGDWVHISFRAASRARRQVLTARFDNGRVSYLSGLR